MAITKQYTVIIINVNLEKKSQRYTFCHVLTINYFYLQRWFYRRDRSLGTSSYPQCSLRAWCTARPCMPFPRATRLWSHQWTGARASCFHCLLSYNINSHQPRSGKIMATWNEREYFFAGPSPLIIGSRVSCWKRYQATSVIVLSTKYGTKW